MADNSFVTAGAPGQLGTNGPVVGKNGGLFGVGDDHTLSQLAQSGYQFYTPTAAPNVAPYFQTNQAPEQQFRAGEVGLMNTLNGQAQGIGPSAAIGTLQAGRDQTMANLMSAIAAGRGSPGTATGALDAGAMASQQAANQAAIMRAREQQSAQEQLGQVTGTGMSADLAEQQLKANQGSNLASMLNSQYQFGQTINEQQRAALNASIAQAVSGANSSQQGLLGQSIGALGGLGSGLLSAGTGGLSSLFHPGGGGGSPSVGAGGYQAAPGGATVNMPGQFYGSGHVADHGPEAAVIGDGGPEVVLPIHPNGLPDMSRATDPRLKWILESHGKDSYAVPGSEASGMPGPLPAAHDHGILGQIVAFLHDVQNPMRAR